MGNWRHESITGRMNRIKEGVDQNVGVFRAGDPGHTCMGHFWADAELALSALADADEEMTRLEDEAAGAKRELAEVMRQVRADHDDEYGDDIAAGAYKAAHQPDRDEQPLPKLVISRCHAPDSPEMQLEHLEANMARLRDESRDEQPPFASKTPSGIETGF